MQLRQVKILGTGKYLPKNQVTAQQLAQQLQIEESWKLRRVQRQFPIKDSLDDTGLSKNASS
jgi:3-oxoacyl-[acyl-carrier-protein] synthase III